MLLLFYEIHKQRFFALDSAEDVFAVVFFSPAADSRLGGCLRGRPAVHAGRHNFGCQAAWTGMRKSLILHDYILLRGDVL